MDVPGILLHLSPSKHLVERPLRGNTAPKMQAADACGRHYNSLFTKRLHKALNKVYMPSAKWSGASALNANRDRTNRAQTIGQHAKMHFPTICIVRDKCKKNGLASIGIGTCYLYIG